MKKYSFRKKFFITFLSLGIIAFLFLLGINTFVNYKSYNYIAKDPSNLPNTQALMILGSRVYNQERMSDVYKDRVVTALEIYKQGKAKKIIVSGDHGQKYYDEVNIVKEYLLDHNVPPEDIFLDHAGFDTYDSMYRAKNIFQVDSLIVVTQEFHLSRSIYIARSLGVDAIGYKADRQVYIKSSYFKLRESFARIKAFLNVMLHSSPSALGNPIPIDGDGRSTWD